MASVAQNCTPQDFYLLALVGIAEYSLQSLAGIVLGTTDGGGVGREVLLLEALHGHLACGNLLAGTEAHDEQFSTCHQVHGLAAQEVDGLLALEEAGGQYIVVQGINLTLLLAHGGANGILLLGINPCLGVGLALAQSGHVVVGNRNGLCVVVHIYYGKLAFLLRCHHVAGRESTGYGYALTVGIGLAIDGYAYAILQIHGVGVNLHLADNPTATGILAGALLPQTYGDIGIIQRIRVLAAIPVHVLGSSTARGGVGHKLIHITAASIYLLCLPRLCTGFVCHEFGLVGTAAIAGRLGVRHPFLAIHAVDVVRVVLTVLGIERKLAGISFCLCGRGEGCHGQPIAVFHSEHALWLVHRYRCLDGIRLCPSRHSREQQS